MHKYIVVVDDGVTKYYDFNNPNKRHRLDGPAVEYTDGTKTWYINGQLHRENGPAVEWADGSKQWWVDGERLSEEEFNKRTQSCEGKVVEIDGKKYRLTAV